MTESPYPGPHIQVDLDTWAQRIESKLDRYHEDMQRQILELQKAPDPVKDGEVRVSSLESRVAHLESEGEENTRFRLDSVVSHRMVARGWGVAATVGALSATLFQVISGALR